MKYKAARPWEDGYEQLPDEELPLYGGSIVMVMRTTHTRKDQPNYPRTYNGPLYNGTRLQVLAYDKRDDSIVCVFIYGPNSGKRVRLYRESFTVQYGAGHCHNLTMRQFPIRLAYAVTITKAQGQTFEKVGVHLGESDCFAHGQLYVALSRVRRACNLKVWGGPSNEMLNICLTSFNLLNRT